MSNNNGGPAFPIKVEWAQDSIGFDGEECKRNTTSYYSGMTLRDYFAAKAMQGILANSEANRSWTDDDVAKFAYRQADAMIAERNKAKN